MAKTLIYIILLYLLTAHACVGFWMSLHIWVHVLYVIFPFEPQWLLSLHNRTAHNRAEYKKECGICLREGVSRRG